MRRALFLAGWHTVLPVAYPQLCGVCNRVMLTVSATGGVRKDNLFILYPNPVKDVLQIALHANSKAFTVTVCSGEGCRPAPTMQPFPQKFSETVTTVFYIFS